MKNKPLILGHRGYRKKYPENTMLAFKKAYKYGADGIECDIQKTRDRLYVVTHEDRLYRIAGHKGHVGGLTYKFLKKLDLGRGECIPLFKDFLDSLPRDKFINIELKDETMKPDDSPVILSMLKERGLKENILMSSFFHPFLPVFKKAGYRIGLLFEEEDFNNGIGKPLISVLKYRPWSVNLPINRFTGDNLNFKMSVFLKIAKLLRMKIIYWTVNTEKQYNEVAPYAHTVITDNVELMVKLQKSRLNEQGVR
ncbi:MAG TPA: glycerophosphodiester phosphodiesterase family protein [Spirochaetota bacterium]|nr:glycerophosphodiester phosphodiesterase family protein [Spirochaetota bacterium]